MQKQKPKLEEVSDSDPVEGLLLGIAGFYLMANFFGLNEELGAGLVCLFVVFILSATLGLIRKRQWEGGPSNTLNLD